MNFPLYIAKRYLVSKSSNNAINIITIIAALGSIVATAALFVVLSGFSGLKEFSISFFNAADPDIKVQLKQGKSFVFTDSLQRIFESDKRIEAFAKILEERAFFNYQNKEHIAYIKGIDKSYTNVVRIDTTLIAGKWLTPENPYGVVTGNGISNKLSLGIDYLNPMRIYVPKPGTAYNLENPESMIRFIQVQNAGIFSILDDIDNKYVFSYLPVAQELLGYKLNQISAVSLRLKKGVDPDAFSRSFQEKIGNKYRIKTRAQLNAVFYKMLNTENLVLYFIFTLVLIIALFNIIGAIIMMILDKKTNLKTLLSLGSQVQDLRRIFLLQGFLLSVFGLVAGLFLGVILVFLQDRFHLFMINPYLPYPVLFRLQNLLIVVVTMLVLGYLAAKIASSRITKEQLKI